MTCSVRASAPDGSTVTARALLDSASSASFISERLARALNLPRFRQNTHISGIAGITKTSPLQSIARFSISTSNPPGETINLTAIVVPKVACDLPLQSIPFDPDWNHLSGIPLADPDFASPGKVDILLGVEAFVAVLLDGRRSGLPGSPVAFETKLGWVLAGNTDLPSTENTIVTYHASVLTGDDLLREFWELKENSSGKPPLSPEEHAALGRSEISTTVLSLAGSLCLCQSILMPSHWENRDPRQYVDLHPLNVPFMLRGSFRNSSMSLTSTLTWNTRNWLLKLIWRNHRTEFSTSRYMR